MAELTSTKLNAESHLVLVRYFLAPLWCLALRNQGLFCQANPLPSQQKRTSIKLENGRTNPSSASPMSSVAETSRVPNVNSSTTPKP